MLGLETAIFWEIYTQRNFGCSNIKLYYPIKVHVILPSIITAIFVNNGENKTGITLEVQVLHVITSPDTSFQRDSLCTKTYD
jgi:hypothetical protein